MLRIIKIGMDVHSKNYALCAIEPILGEEGEVLAATNVSADYKNIILFIERLKQKLGLNYKYEIECGYEAGCLGYSLYHQLTRAGIKCVILAPTTMKTTRGKRIKTDARDALLIAQCLGSGGYRKVHIPDDDDNAVKEFIRMRDDQKNHLKKTKQHINAFCLRYGLFYEGTKWTTTHLNWIRKLDLSPLLKETLNEYMATYDVLSAKIDRLDQRIEELANMDRYQEKVKRLICFIGIQTHTALSLIVETCDFERFDKGCTYGAFLGLVPGEHTSSDNVKRLSITKKGNCHLRSLLIESAHGICKGAVGRKSRALKARQEGNPADVIAYADMANARMRNKYYRLIRRGKKRNVAVAAIARELACYVWGMMTDNITRTAN